MAVRTVHLIARPARKSPGLGIVGFAVGVVERGVVGDDLFSATPGMVSSWGVRVTVPNVIALISFRSGVRQPYIESPSREAMQHLRS